MAYTFEINPHALKRHFSVYVVVAQGHRETLLYIGKTGDNREGSISRVLPHDLGMLRCRSFLNLLFCPEPRLAA